MANKCGKLPKLKESPGDLVLRFADVRPQEDNAIVVVATETPVERWDDSRGFVIREVLLMDGCVFRGGRDRIPMVDSHDDSTVRNIIGSVASLTINRATGELYGKPEFASDDESQTIARKFNEQHITDFSITAKPLDGFYLARGETFTTPRGELIEGPANIITAWEPHNASICATGADVNSTVRRSYTDLKRKVTRMDEALMATLSGLGVPEDMQDPNAVIAFLAGKLSGDADDSSEPEMVESMESEKTDEVAPVENMENEEPETVESMSDEKDKIENVSRSATEAERLRVKEIYASCKVGRVERAFADQLVSDGVPLDVARDRIIRKMANSALGQTAEQQSVRVTESAQDKFYGAVRDGLIARACRGARLNAQPQVSKDAQDFSQVGLNRLAELVLRQAGVQTDRMSSVDIAKVAMGNRDACRRHRIERDAYHTTGSFPNLLLDAANKTLLQAYEEAPFTWNQWARQAPSVADFKNINRIRFSESPDPEMVPENTDYKEKVMSDSKESYKVEKYGALFSVTWETVVNDDLDAISRIPAMHGAACRRKVNKEVYAVLTSNPTMGDSVALFGSHTSGTNLSGSDANPTTTTLNAAFKAMMTQKGLSADAIINVQPRHLIVPVALSAESLQFVASMADPAAGGSNAGNSNTLNIYGPNGQRPLNVIVEPQLDANSATAWYLAADPSQIDTVEVTFLQGEESPVLESDWDFDKDVYKYKVRQTFGVKAIDWRGLYKYAAS